MALWKREREKEREERGEIRCRRKRVEKKTGGKIEMKDNRDGEERGSSSTV